MRFSKVAAVAALSAVTEAQRPSNTSICDYYTTALLKDNTAANQLLVLTLLVNTVVIGNYTKPNIAGVTFPTNVTVPGILAKGTVNGETVDLLPYFDGGLASSNRGGAGGVAVNFLDDGGAIPLMMNKPANGTSSNQYKLLTHLYQFFGTALGCSQQGMSAFPAYQGVASQYSVHKFMGLDYAQVTYFIQNVGLAAESFGVSYADYTAVGMELNNLFNARCGPATTVIPSAGPVLQSICIDSDCPLAANSSCSGYDAATDPGIANPSLADGQGSPNNTFTASFAGGATASGSMSMSMSGNSTMSMTMSGSGAAMTGSTAASGMMSGTAASSAAGATSSTKTGAGVKNVAGGVAAGFFGLAAFFL